MQATCTGQNRDGRPCSATPRPGTEWCAWHDPSLTAERATWRRQGGQARSNASRARKALAGDVRDLTGLQATLLAALGKVERGELDAGPANAMANIARAVVAVAEATKAAEFEGRLADLERLTGTGRR